MTVRFRHVIWILAILVALTIYLVIHVNPIIVAYSQSRIESLTVKAVNEAIGDVLSIDTYSKLTVIYRDGQNKIEAVGTDMVLMNQISGKIAIQGQKHIEESTNSRLGVPLWTFSGLPILTGRGPEVPLRVVPVGTVLCTFNSEFIGQGINQTLHRIVLSAQVTVNLIMPLGSRIIHENIDVLLCENVIIGEVPEIYLGNR